MSYKPLVPVFVCNVTHITHLSHLVENQAQPSMTTALFDGSYLFDFLEECHKKKLDNEHCHSTKTAQEWLDEHNKEQKSFTRTLNSLHSNPTENPQDVRGQTQFSRPHPATQKIHRMPACRCQRVQDLSGGKVS